MTTYVKHMIDKFPKILQGKMRCPWNETLFKVDEKSNNLNKNQKKLFHTFVMKGMFLCKRARQDLLLGIVFLSTRVWEPMENNWKKLTRLVDYLKVTKNKITSMSADDTQTISGTSTHLLLSIRI